ncbi:autotransporter outer membrane beta-barrel domain-containing protein [Yersinia enterocolitica]|nr:autotransporter outer membrane beta-barrel domain-containing protein [Yersinia enterocolitica]
MNAIFKVIWNISLSIWVAVGEFAKGKQKSKTTQRGSTATPLLEKSGKHLSPKIAIVAAAVMGVFGIQPAFAISVGDCAAMGTNCVTVSTAAGLVAALSSAGAGSTATTILLTADINLATAYAGGITVNQAANARQNLVIDGGGYNLNYANYAFLMAAGTTNNAAWSSQNATFQLVNFGDITSTLAITSGIVSRLVYVQDDTTRLDVTLDNIKSVPNGKLVAMGVDSAAVAPNKIGRVIFGNITQPITLNFGTYRQSVLGSNITFTGHFNLTGITSPDYPAVFWSNDTAANSVLHFANGADVNITGTRLTNGPGVVGVGVASYNYMIDDGAKLTLTIDSQNPLGVANYGVQIGSYNPVTGLFGSGAVINMNNLAGDVISNAPSTTTTSYIYNGPASPNDVIYNLAAGSNLVVAAGAANDGIIASKTLAGTGNIYIRSAATISDGTQNTTAGTGINISAASSGNVVVRNEAEGTIRKATGISVTDTGSGTVNVTNAGTINSTTAGIVLTHNGSGTASLTNSGSITSTTAGIAVSAATAQTINIDNTGGTVSASAGTGINVLTNALLNMVGGAITTTGAANALTFAGTSNSHVLTDLILNLNGTGAAFSKAAGVNLALNHIIFNTVTGTALNSLAGLTFANSVNGNNIINVTGAGTGINSVGGVDLSNAYLDINVTDSAGTGLQVADGAVTATTIGANTLINATGATAINFAGTTAKTLNNNGTINGAVTFAGTAANIINNNSILNGSLTTGSGSDTLALGSTSQSNGAINLGDGNNNVTIENGAQVSSITTGTGDDTFTLNNMTLGSTYLGALNAGSGSNTLNFNNSFDSLASGTSLQGFTNINLIDSQITLNSDDNVGSGAINISASSELLFGSTFNSTLNASLGHVAGGDGLAIVDNGANVSLSQASTFAGDWQVNQSGTLTVSNSNQLGTSNLSLDGTLNLNGVATYNNSLLGTGLLNIDTANNTFNFGANTGTGFAGTIDMKNTVFTLSGDNTAALSNASFIASAGALVAVDNSNQAIGNFILNGGTSAFSNGSLITADTLAVTNDSNIRVDPAMSTAGNILDQDTGSSVKLIDSSNTLSATDLARLTLMDLSGASLGPDTSMSVIQGASTVAQALYNYTLSGVGSGLSITSVLTRLAIISGQTLTLTSQGALDTNKLLTAQLTGSGNLAIGADNSEMTLNNATNDYTGSTLVNGGILNLGSDNALGQTSGLTTAAGTNTNINGHSQTVGALTNAGTVTLGTGGVLNSGVLSNSSILDITGGTLNLAAGGVSTATGGLTGAGTLNINGGDLAVSGANSGLSGQTLIASGASATLNGAGTLGSSAINVLGDLNLNGANAALANVLSGTGDINTNAAVTLTGTNSFSGAHHIGATGALTVTQAGNLGASTATVNLDTATSNLVLNGLSGAVANALSGVADSTVDINNGANVSLTGNNSGFLGQYALADSSKLTVASTNNLGAASSVALAGAQDILALSGFNGIFGNTVTGSGILQVTDSSDVTLNNTNSVDNAVTVDITDATLNLADIALFDHVLTGTGTLNIDTANNIFNFGVNTGTAFAGTIDMENTVFALSGDNTSTLGNALFVASGGTLMTVGSGNQILGNFTLNGATTVFGSGSLIVTDTLAVTNSSTIQVDPALTTGGNLLDQDTGSSAQLISSNNTLSTPELALLTLQDSLGNSLGNGTTEDITQGSNIVAEALYNYGLSGNGGGLSVTSSLTQLTLLSGQSLTLTSQGAVNADHTLLAKVTGTGNLAIGADNSEMTLNNATNDYTGSTLVNGGILNLGSDNALGQTSGLTTAAGTNTNINGHSQTVGALTNAGTVTLGTGGVLNSGVLSNSSILDITGGTLNLAAGGVSTATGGLTGAGTLNINGGDLAVSGANSGLSGQALIASGASATLNGADTLGSSAINVLGDLNLNGANAALANVLSGTGDINTNAAITLTGTNSFSGAHHIGAAGTLSVGQASNLGASTATVNLDTATSHLVLNGLSGAVANALSGVADSTVDINNGANVSLTGNNSGFLGQYALADSSKLTVASTNNLGAVSSVALAGAQDILALSGFNGIFGNTVTGSGILQVTDSSDATLNNTNSVDNAVTVDITDATLNLADIALFDHVLTGSGTLNVAKNDASTAFDFGSSVGGAFSGIVNLTNSTFALNAGNTAALANATLKLSANNVTTVGTDDRTLHGLDLSGGTLIFDGAAPQSQASGVVTVTDLALNSGTISVTGTDSWTNQNPVLAPNLSILDQDRGDIMLALINAGTVSGAASGLNLMINGTTVTDTAQGVVSAILQGGTTVANATHNYGLTSSNGSGSNGLYVNYSLSALELLTDGADALLLATDSSATSNKELNALVSGVGGLQVDATNGALTLANGSNSYQGTTTVNAGELILGANGAFGQTSLLDIASGASANINGRTQTVGALTNAGTVTLGTGGVLNSGVLSNSSILDITGGTLNLAAGGVSTATGGLTGAGTLNINGGDLAVSGANSGLSGQTLIASGASATLNGAGTLGSSAINVLGDLNLNGANAALANVLSGTGDINTNAAVTLTGTNSFSGAHHIGATGALTVTQAGNLGASTATVNLDTATSNLVLNGLSGAVANALSGVADSTVDINNGANVSLTGNNSGFLGQYALADSSKLTVASTNNLGAASSVALAGAQDILALSGFNGIFGNTVTGSGILQVTDSSDVTLNNTNSVDNAVTVDITDATLNLADIALFDHVLTGSGTLNVAKNDASTAFDFGSSVGGAFSGIVNLTNSTFALNAGNTAALANATLKLSANNVTTVGTDDRTLHGLDLSGGTLIFDGAAPQSQASGVVTVTDLALNSGTISVTGTDSWTNQNPVLAPNLSILDQDRGDIMLALINAGTVSGAASGLNLMINGTTVTDTAQGVVSAILQGGTTVANATHNYGLTSSNGSGGNGLYVNYSLSALELLTDGADALLLATDSSATSNKELNALVSGVGGLQVDATNGALTLANGSNSYQGTTTVNAGELILGANGAFGQTSLLDIASGASANINGHTQTVGALTNAGTVTLGTGGVLSSTGALSNSSSLNIAGGTLNLAAGGVSTATGGLTGAGTLNINGGDLAVSGANSGLSGQTLIASGASATLNGAGTLGSSAINVLGDLNLNGANAALANVLSGTGDINTNAAVTLTGTNSFSGAHHIGAAGTLSVGQASNLGASTATVNLDTATSNLVLNGLSGAVANALSGVADSTVDINNGANVSLTGNNSGFLGQYALADSSKLTVASTNNLGAASSVALAGAQDILALSGFNGIFGNTVTGSGILQVTDSSDVTLNNTNSVDNAVTVDITDATLNLADIALFDHVLTGSGTLNVAKNDASTAFDFGSSVGGAFSGIVNLQNTIFNIDGLNTTALTNSTLKLSSGSLASVADGVQNIGGLALNGGTLLFNNLVDNSGIISSLGTLTANNIDTTGGGEVRVNLPANVTPDLGGLSVMQLDEGEIIVTLASGAATGTGHELTLSDALGDPLSATVYQSISNPGALSPAALGSFNYGMTTGTGFDGLYVNYGLKALELQSTGNDALILTATLANNGTQANDLSAQVTGSGDLAFVSANDGSIASLSNSTNSYTGATWVRAGNVRLAADSALGQTSLLAMSTATNVDLNGTQQTVGQLATETGSTLDFNSGKLTVTNGGQVDGVLTGVGELDLAGGLLSITQANSGFTGSTDIASGATAHLYQVQGLGSGAINNNGLLNLDNTSGELLNALAGSGNVQLSNSANVQLAADNSGYSGLFTTDAGTVLTANNAGNLGSSSVANNGELILDTASVWNLSNAISGSGTLVKRGSGTVKIDSGTVSASLTTIENGLLQLGSSTATSTLTVNESPLARTLVATLASNVVNLVSDVLITNTGSLGGYGQVTGNVENRGNLIMPNALTGGDFGTFIIDGNYTGDNGTVVFNTILAGDSSVTDRLLITGNTAGQSFVTVNNIGGNGARTSEGIKIIDVGGDSAGQFTLNGRAVAGAYEYFLYQGGVSSPTDGDWYLRTQADERRPEPASYTANLAAANSMFVTSLADRSGETVYTDVFTGEEKTTSLWLRNEGSHNRSRDDSGELKTQDNRYVMQLGGDVAQWSRNTQDLWRVGVMAGYANSSSSSVAQETGYRSNGSVDGYSVGVYGTWFADSQDNTGAYVDTWLQYSWFNNQVDGQDLTTEKYDSKGFTAAVESGYAFKVGQSVNQNYFIQPKAQVVWMGVKADSHTETNGTVVSGEGNNNIQTRLGVKAFISPIPTAEKANVPAFKPYVEANWVHNTKDFGTTLDGITVKQAGAANIAELKLGVEGQINNKLNLWGNVGQQVGNNGYSDSSITLGVKYNF